jgi:predicted amidohydrolase
VRRLAAILLVLILAGGVWGIYRAPSGQPAVDTLYLTEIDPATQDGPHLVAVQPWLETRHYQSAGHLLERLDGYMTAARGAGYLDDGSIVVFPEHVGTWLVAARAPRWSFSAATTGDAMTHLVLANPLPYLIALARSHEADRSAAAIFRMRARRMAADYQSVFSTLAERYGVTVVAGSIVLPAPEVDADGRLVPGNGPLYNTAAVFAPDGSLHSQLVRKVHPIPDEAGFTAAAEAGDIPVFDTPAGRLGVLVCADSWHPDVYATLAAGGAEIVAVPAFLQPSDTWEAPWGGYTTGWPEDADRADAGRLSEAQAWMTYALAGRLDRAGARSGATAFLRGQLWDLGSDGANILVDDRNGARIAGQDSGASISALPLAPPPPSDGASNS